MGPELDIALASLGIRPLDGKFEKDLVRQRLFIEFQVKRAGEGRAAQLTEQLGLISGVRRVRVE